MMLRLLSLTVLLFAAPVLSFPSKTLVRSVHLNGNYALSARQLLDVMDLKPNVPFSPAQLSRNIQSLVRLYRQNGFYFVEVDADSLVFSSDSSGVDVFVEIDEHDRLEVGSVRLEGNTVFATDDILRLFDTRTGRPLDERILERDINDLLGRYERAGYPFAEVEIENIIPVRTGVSGTLEVDIVIDEGSKVQINEIQIVGNTETRDDVILREARIKPGEAFDQQKLVNVRQRLNRLNIFSDVHEPELYMNSVGGGILIRVQEGATNTFDGVVGYAPGSPGNNEGTLTGLVNASMRNLFGTARKLHVQWLKDDSHSQEISLNYVEPWIFDFPVNMAAGFMQRQQESIYVRRALELKADVLISESFTLGAIFNHESTIPAQTNRLQSISDSRTVTMGVEILYDSRDDILSPTRGVNYRSDYRVGSKRVVGAYQFAGNDVHTVQKVSLDADFYVEALVHQVLAFGLHGRQLTSDIIEAGDLYRFGGTATLRGYRENQFLGSRVAWTNTEYRFLLARHSFFFGFFDSGYYFLPGDNALGVPSIQHLKYGYGVGIRLETSLGNVGVSVALGEGDTFSQAKLHIGLLNEF